MRFRTAISALLALGLALSFPQYAGAQATGVKCNKRAIYDASTSGSTKLVDSITGRNVYICGFLLFSVGTVNLKFVYGTGATCGTGTVDITPAFQFTAQSGISDSAAEFRGLFVPSGSNVCFNASGGVAAQAILYYNQQ